MFSEIASSSPPSSSMNVTGPSGLYTDFLGVTLLPNVRFEEASVPLPVPLLTRFGLPGLPLPISPANDATHGVAVGDAGVGVPPHPPPRTMSSMFQPIALTELSVASLNRIRRDCPAYGVRLTLVCPYPPLYPFQAFLPPMGEPNDVEIGPSYPPLVMLGSMSTQVEPLSVVASSTPPS